MTLDELEYIEKVKLPEYEGYGWANATKDLRRVIADYRKHLLSEHSDEARPYTAEVSGSA